MTDAPAEIVRRLFERHPFTPEKPWALVTRGYSFIQEYENGVEILTAIDGEDICSLASEYQRLKSENAALKEAVQDAVDKLRDYLGDWAGVEVVYNQFPQLKAILDILEKEA